MVKDWQPFVQSLTINHPITRSPNHQILPRAIGLSHAVAMVIGTIVGASIFVQPSEVSRSVPTFAGMLLVWVVAGLLTWFGASICAELSSAYPRTGGVYVFLREMFSAPAGFLWGWAMFWSMHSGIIAAIAVIFARYLALLVPLDDGGVRAAAAGAILALSAVNYLGVRSGAMLQTTLTAIKVGAIAVLLITLLAAAHAPVASVPAAFDVVGFVRATGAGLFAFGGWHMVTYAAEETRDPARTIPRALMIGTALVVVIYLSLNAAYLLVLPLDRVLASTRIAADATAAAAGPRAATLIALLVVVSSFGALSGIILAGPRVYFAMAEDGLIFKWMARIHPRFRTPSAAIAAQAVWSAGLAYTGTYRALFTRVVFTEWIFFGALAVGAMRMRRHASYRPVFRAWGFPATPLVFAVACAAVVLGQMASEPRESAIGLGIVLAGLPVFFIWRAINASR
jgi:basic amino acid/polyamine antiporter, APA family